MKIPESQKDYKNEINSFVSQLENKYKQNREIEREINNLKININRIKPKIKNEELFKDLDISSIIDNRNAKLPLFIRAKTKELLSKEKYFPKMIIKKKKTRYLCN